jgi:hypothetical protein
MAEQNKSKTKAVILRELESIKGLLLDDDDIPLLQEVIDHAEEETGTQATLDGDDLAELQQAYRDLLQAREMDEEIPTLEEEEPPSLPDIEEQLPSPQTQPKREDTANEKASRKEVQTSLFDMDSPLADKATAQEPAQKRNSVTKASGENPFLPAHIRERLHGNRPPPLFEPAPPALKTKPAPETSSPPTRTPDRAHLVEEVVASILPEVEAKLRRKLLEMDADQLRQMLEEAPRNDELD